MAAVTAGLAKWLRAHDEPKCWRKPGMGIPGKLVDWPAVLFRPVEMTLKTKH